MTKEYVEADLGCAAFLDASGYKLIGLKELGPNRLGFWFDDPCQTAERDAARYFAGATVGAERLAMSIRSLKARLRAEKQIEKMERKYAHTETMS